MMRKILVTGSLGQLGSEIQSLSSSMPSYQFYFYDKNDLDILDYSALAEFFTSNPIDYIINCAAYTAVDMAEKEEDLAMQLNYKAVDNLLKASSLSQAKLFQISTDYVFGGMHNLPFKEDEKTNPESVYGKSKLLGEQMAMESKRSIIIRTSWLYSVFGNNFVKTIRKYASEKDTLNVVFDQIGAPTYARDLAQSILDIINKVDTHQEEFKSGIYHYANEGVLSWYDFAKEIVEISKIDVSIKPVRSDVFPTPAKRPPYSVLCKEKIKNTYGIQIPYWKDSLKACIQILEQ